MGVERGPGFRPPSTVTRLPSPICSFVCFIVLRRGRASRSAPRQALAAQTPASPPPVPREDALFEKSIAELGAMMARAMPWVGQENFECAQKRGALSDRKYLDARATCLRLTRAHGIDAVRAKHRLDALDLPSNQPAWTTNLLNGDHFTGGDTTYAAVSGYPSVTVPMGAVHQLPVGLSFIGNAWAEGQLLAISHAFELMTKGRRSPTFIATLG